MNKLTKDLPQSGFHLGRSFLCRLGQYLLEDLFGARTFLGPKLAKRPLQQSRIDHTPYRDGTLEKNIMIDGKTPSAYVRVIRNGARPIVKATLRKPEAKNLTCEGGDCRIGTRGEGTRKNDSEHALVHVADIR